MALLVNEQKHGGQQGREETNQAGLATVLAFRPRAATATDDRSDDGCQRGPLPIGAGQGGLTGQGTDATDDQIGVIGSRTDGQVVPASRIEALRVERSAAPHSPDDKSMERPAGRDGRSPYLGVIVKSSTLKSPLSGVSPADQGMVVHALIGAHVPHIAAGTTVAALLPHITQMARSLVQANANRRAAVAAQCVGLACRYLADLVPGSDWHLLGVEWDTGHGPVDVAWAHMATGAVLFDEIKTSRIVGNQISVKWRQQVNRYTAGGTEMFGDRFVGTRLLPLPTMRLARLVLGPGVPSTPLAPVVGDPLRAPATTRPRSVDREGGR